MSVVVLHSMNRTSSGAEFGSPAMYDSRYTVCSDVVLVEGFGLWTWCPDVIFIAGFVMLAFIFIEFWLLLFSLRLCFYFCFCSGFGSFLVGYYYAFPG
jgi:hypothetical protein